MNEATDTLSLDTAIGTTEAPSPGSQKVCVVQMSVPLKTRAKYIMFQKQRAKEGWRGKCRGQTFGAHVSYWFIMFAHFWRQLLAPELGKVAKKRAAQYAVVKRSKWWFYKIGVPLNHPF